jgi:hypothetical protein
MDSRTVAGLGIPASHAIMDTDIMGLFRRKKKPDRKEPERPSLVALLDSPVSINQPAIIRALEAMEPLRLPPKFDLLADPPTEEHTVLYGHVELDSHRVKLIGVDVPMPESVLAATVDVAPLTGEYREELHGHKAQLILVSEGGGRNALERCIALLKLASAIGSRRLLGVASEAGFTALPAEAVHDLMTPKGLTSLREAIPPVVFTGSFRLRDEHGADWMVTRGHQLFGVPDLVMRADPMQARTILELFNTILSYAVKSEKALNPGDTMQLDDKLYMRLLPLKPDDEEGAHDPILRGKDKTLEVTLIKPDEINKPRKKRRD